MKGGVAGYIVWGNLALVVLNYALAAAFVGAPGGFFLTYLQMFINGVLAIILTIIYIFKKQPSQVLGGFIVGFWVAGGILAVLALPSCILVTAVSNALEEK